MSVLGEQFERLVALMARLRSPQGCPWDREQTFASIEPYTVEETYEVLAAIDKQDWPGLADELGDLLLQILFYAQMACERAADAGRFTIADVLAGLEAKLVRRHPHVFGGEGDDPRGAAGVVERWDAIKRGERRETAATEEAGLGAALPGLPAVVETYRISGRAARAGFEWPEAAAVLDKLAKEIAELRHELCAAPADAARLKIEVGDLLFTAVNVARRLEIEPESALKAANRKFRHRFAAVAAERARGGKTLAASSAEELNETWETVKKRETR